MFILIFVINGDLPWLLVRCSCCYKIHNAQCLSVGHPRAKLKVLFFFKRNIKVFTPAITIVNFLLWTQEDFHVFIETLLLSIRSLQYHVHHEGVPFLLSDSCWRSLRWYLRYTNMLLCQTMARCASLIGLYFSGRSINQKVWHLLAEITRTAVKCTRPALVRTWFEPVESNLHSDYLENNDVVEMTRARASRILPACCTSYPTCDKRQHIRSQQASMGCGPQLVEKKIIPMITRRVSTFVAPLRKNTHLDSSGMIQLSEQLYHCSSHPRVCDVQQSSVV